MAITRLPATALSGTSLPSTITSASGLPLGKLINSSRAFLTSGTVTLNTSSTTDTGFDHTYTASSTSHKLLHMINCAWRKNTEGGHAGSFTIYADDSSISEISNVSSLGEWHQDSATTDIKGSTVHYFSASSASTNAIKYSIYGNCLLYTSPSPRDDR